MDLLKRLFPISAKEKDLKSLIIAIVIYIVIGAVGGALLGALSGIKVLGILFSIVGALFELYTIGGIIISILNYMGVKI
mgnify:FL=1